MHSLYHTLLAHHSRQLTPIRCSFSTIARLQTFFEDVVLENSLSSLVIESLPTDDGLSVRETNRVRKLSAVAEKFLLFVTSKKSLSQLEPKKALVLDRKGDDFNERFVIIADGRFSALLAATTESSESSTDSESALVIWTFEPDVVFSALEYLMARMTAEYPQHAKTFGEAVRLSMPKATSLQLTLAVTTKLARLLQQQAEREIAINHIANAIRNSLDLNCLLQTAVNEVGRALNATRCAVQIEGELVGNTKTEWFLDPDTIVADEEDEAELVRHLDNAKRNLVESQKSWIIDGDSVAEKNFDVPQAAVPVLYRGLYVGLLLVQSNTPRVWADNELLLLHTVADQLTVGVTQAHLFEQLQLQALSDALTGCHNRRAFEMQLERDLHLAIRMRQSLSLVMIDLDDFKLINDKAGHHTGDAALRIIADCLRSELRAVDSPARFGGDEFAVILPQADSRGARIVAERLRKRIAETKVPGYGFLSASFGFASFPEHASSRDTLVVAADRALYLSKAAGGNTAHLPPGEKEKPPKPVMLTDIDTEVVEV